MKKIIILIFLILIYSSAFGNAKFQLIDTYGSNSYSQSQLWSGNFIAPNGQKFLFGNFYKSKNIQLNLKTKLLFEFNENFLIIPLSFGNGYKSDLFNTTQMYSIGLIIGKKFNHFNFLLGIDNALVKGGKIKEKPCVDKFNREFHCRTGLPWTDYKNDNIYNFYQDEIFFKVHYKF